MSPLFEFKCPKCQRKEEVIVSFSATVECDECKVKMEKLISIPSPPVFKGTGFYATDYKKQGK